MRWPHIFLLWLIASPAPAEDLSLDPAHVSEGRTLYRQKCASCHGKDASGGSGPDVQGILPSDVTSSSLGIENMPSIELEEGEAEAIGAYLMSLAPEQAKRRLELQ